MQIIFQDNSFVNLPALQAKFQKSILLNLLSQILLFKIKIFLAGRFIHSSSVDVVNK
jgi:hypothetical protein